ncbi:hypothetical protein S4054249_20580 [Pseudoalteromonas luteoviolacea]|nr:hypothetical protein S4054249_20580 [Pseudoalteromonas luteoviolacea]AOT19889.1 hypothetical protein S4054_20555 [Pseudoalteromonas luteoviolacea]KZN72465.1 hypothetical protein N481_14645 [Pseudoalteromonas luteoviolacea S4047-1]
MSLLFSGMLLYITVMHYQLSAITALVVLFSLAQIIWLTALYHRAQRFPEQLFRALSNGDHTLGLPVTHPLRQDYEKARNQMQETRLDAQRQVQFINAVFNHINLPLLICDEQGQIIEQSSAAKKILNIKINNLESLKQGSPDIFTFVSSATTNQQSSFTWHRNEQPETLYVQVSTLQIQYLQYKIVTLQSITEQLNAKEQQAYKQLTKVLTHEVANSITPLASMAQTCLALMPDGLQFDDQEDKQDLTLALSTLASRSTHLSEFIREFRHLSNLPAPQLQAVQLYELLSSVKQLFDSQHPNVMFRISGITQVMCTLDIKQIEQVLINLCKNAIEAIATTQNTQPQIDLIARYNEHAQLCVDICDNGPGITEQASKMMFVPFFSTKQQGSGIGLSLSKQIMLQHGGELIYLHRSQGACFRCVFG